MENNFFHLALDPARLQWTLRALRPEGAVIENPRTSVFARLGRSRRMVPQTWQSAQSSGVESLPSPHGQLKQLCLHGEADATGLECRLTFALPDEQPLFLWKLEVENRGRQPLFIDRLEMLDCMPVLASGNRGGLMPWSRQAFFSNGWQSWNYSGAYGAQNRFRRTRLGIVFAPMRVNFGTPHPKDPGHFSSELFGVLGDRGSRQAILAGFLSQQAQFGSLEAWVNRFPPRLRMWANGDGVRLDPGRSMATDWACLQLLDVDSPDPFGPYLQAVARQHGLPETLETEIPTGWSSWYYFYGKVTAQDVRRNLQTAASLSNDLPLDLIQIDDGFERWVGDWFSFKPGFPEGVASLAKEIAEAGFTPGLWLAPFIVDPRSQLAAKHPDWLLRGRFNRPVNAGFGMWGNFATALDLTHPEALEYACQAVRTAAHQWGFPYLKLDFLYAAALPGRYRDPTQTRAQVMRRGLQALRQAAGDQVTLLGCGCPLGSAIGLVDLMRIGSDVSDRWLPAYQGIESFFHHEPDYPSTRNAIQNALTRSPLHRRWWVNDPDAMLLRPNVRLSQAEVQSLASVIALTGGSLLFSDDLPALPEASIRLGQSLLPPIGRRPRLLDWFDSPTPARLRLDLKNETGAWHLLALFNWEDRPAGLRGSLKDFGLHFKQAHLRQFWNGKTQPAGEGPLRFPEVAPHGVVLLAVRPTLPGAPCYLGSDLHISQGMEVASWQAGPDGVNFSLERPGRAAGLLDLFLPYPPQEARLDGRPLTWQSLGGQIYRFPVDFDHQAHFTLIYHRES